MLVVGGYNSSNTVQPGADLRRARPDVSHRRTRRAWCRADEIRHRPVGAAVDGDGHGGRTERLAAGDRPLIVGLTAGASTPNNIVGQVIGRLEQFANGSAG